MAFLLIKATKMAVSSVRDGVQAHKDARDPQIQQREIELDRWGNPKTRTTGMVYDYVYKREVQRLNKGSSGSPGVAGVAASPVEATELSVYEREYKQSIEKPPVDSQGEDYGPQDYSAKGWNSQALSYKQEDAPPAYTETAPSAYPQTRSCFGPAPTQSPAAYEQMDAHRPIRPVARRQSSLSSLSSVSSVSTCSSGEIRAGQNNLGKVALKMAKRERKAAKKMARAERRALKREHRNEKERMKVQHRYEREMAKSGVSPLPR